MPSTSSRAINVREIERAINNIEHIQSHLNFVMQAYAVGAELYAKNGQSLPEDYINAAEILDNCLEGCEAISDVLKDFVKTL